MKNQLLDDRTARDIDLQVSKILRGLGNPEPPLDLDQVRELLKLDRHYYSSQDDGLLRELVSRAMIAGRQVLMRPMLVFEAIRKWDLKALYMPDRKRILIDRSQPELKWRWSEAHEVIHSVVEWHQYLMHGDTVHTLSPDCHAQIESEANFGAGRLLFLQERFDNFARDSALSFKLVKAAQREFGNTLTSCLWRLVESALVPALGIVSQHPHRVDEHFDPHHPCRYFIRSRRFAGEFSSFNELDAFSMLVSNCDDKRAGPLVRGTREVLIRDERGDEHVFLFESFFNQHEALTLLVYLRPRVTSVGVFRTVHSDRPIH